jgi:hypothetical protein
MCWLWGLGNCVYLWNACSSEVNSDFFKFCNFEILKFQEKRFGWLLQVGTILIFEILGTIQERGGGAGGVDGDGWWCDGGAGGVGW